MAWNSVILIGASVVTTGILLGAVYALVAAGVTIVYGSIWLPNATNGQFFMLAGLLLWSLTTDFGVPTLAGAAIVLAFSIPFALVLEKLLIRRFYEVADRNIVYFMVTLGLTQILSGIFSLTYGRWSDSYSIPPIVRGITFLGPYPFPNVRALAMLVALAALAALFVFLRLHPVGRALRAVFQNREAAALRGVDVWRLYRFAFVLAMVVIFAGGLLFATAYSFDLTVAWNMAIVAFAIMIVGGPGSVLGALVVGMVFGFTQAVVAVFANPTIATFSYLVAMLAILLIRPEGLFRR